jgi:replicative DNA helicase
MADLRDSGAIEQDADAVILLHRESYYDRDVSPETEEIELIIDKDRHAAPTKVIMNWKGSTGEIYDLGEDDIL